MSGHVEVAYANQTSYKTMLHEQDIDGELNGVGVSGGNSHHFFKISIDGRVVHNGTSGLFPRNKYFSNTRNVSQRGHFSLSMNFPFDNELEVEIKDDPRSTSCRFWVAYQKDISGSNNDNGASGNQDETNRETYVEDGSVYEEIVVEQEQRDNIKRVLRGDETVSWIELEKDTYVDEPVLASPYMARWGEEGFAIPEQPGELILRLYGRNDPIEQIVVEPSSMNETEFEITPERPGNYELVTNFPDVANFPIGFSVY